MAGLKSWQPLADKEDSVAFHLSKLGQYKACKLNKGMIIYSFYKDSTGRLGLDNYAQYEPVMVVQWLRCQLTHQNHHGSSPRWENQPSTINWW